MNKSKKRTVKTIVFMLVFAIMIISAYFIIKTRTSPFVTESVSTMTEVEKLLAKDVPNSYPSSPREVLKLYSRISKVLYNGDLKEEQVDKLADQMLCLYDKELILNKSHEDYLIDLKVDISNYKKANRIIMNYVIEASSSVLFWDIEDENYSSIVAAYTMKEKSDYSKVFEKFTLRKDKDDKWKILGWDLSDKTEIEPGE